MLPQDNTKRLIVNADDFGMTEKINQAVLEAHNNGIVTSTSLLANGAAFASAVALARQQPGLGVGVHLNLTQGRPVSPASSIPGLVNGNGQFFSSPVGLAEKILARRVSRVELERELRAQIEKVICAGIAITHLDGHKHVHILPSIFDLVVRLAREYRIHGIRCAGERSAGLVALLRRNTAACSAILKQYLGGRALRLLWLGLKGKVERARLSCPTYLFGVTQTGFLDAASLEAILACLPAGVSEILCHPGYVDAELSRIPTRLLAQREKELEALTRPEIKRRVTEWGIELINYRHLAEAR
jgi:hopanoid biosynthesis associated protein HpnK